MTNTNSPRKSGPTNGEVILEVVMVVLMFWAMYRLVIAMLSA